MRLIAPILSMALVAACGGSPDPVGGDGSTGEGSSSGLVGGTEGNESGSSSGGETWPPACVFGTDATCATFEASDGCGGVEHLGVEMWEIVYGVLPEDAYERMVGTQDLCDGPLRVVLYDDPEDPDTAATAASYLYARWDTIKSLGLKYHCEARIDLGDGGRIFIGDQAVYDSFETSETSHSDVMPSPPPMADGEGCCLLEGDPVPGSQNDKPPC